MFPVRTEWLATEIDSDRPERASEALKVVTEGCKRSKSVPEALIRPVLDVLQTEQWSLVKESISASEAMRFYPPPPQLEDVVEEGPWSVRTDAKEAINTLTDAKPEGKLASKLRESDSDTAFFEGQEGDQFLKYRTSDGRWTDIEKSELRGGILSTVINMVDREENVPLVYPYYRPKEIVLLTIGLALGGVSKNPQIGLYSPGSRSQWGMKGEIREELERFAIASCSGEVVRATPLPDVVPHAYVSQGEVKDHSDGEGPGRIIITKKLHELEEIPQLDTVLLNLVSRTKADLQTEFEEIEKRHSNANVVSAYSYYVKKEREERRARYGPPIGLRSTVTVPGPDLIDPIVESDVASEHGSTSSDTSKSKTTTRTDGGKTQSKGGWEIGTDEIHSLSQPAELRVDHVEEERLKALFDQIFEESAGLRDVNDGGAGGLIFSRQLFFERLPIPADDYDEWVRDRYYEGDRFVPPLIQERIEDVERKAGSVENLQGVQPLNTSKRLLERIADRLREYNPLFDRLKWYIEQARSSEERLAIFSESPKNGQLLEEVLADHGLLQERGDEFVEVVTPDSIRSVEPADTLLVFGPLHPEHAAFYSHPRFAETIVVTYDRAWAGMIEHHANEFIEELNGVVGSEGYKPYSKVELVGDIEPIEEDPEGEETEGGDLEPKGEPQKESIENEFDSSSRPKSKQEILVEALESNSTREYQEEASRYERDKRYYAIETEEGDRIEMSNYDRLLRERPSKEEVQYHWISPEFLSSGDTIVRIPDEIQRELWLDRLEELYEEELETDAVVDQHEIWFEAINQIWSRQRDLLWSADEDTPTSAIHEAIYQRIVETNDNFDRNKGTVSQWFDSVREADKPLELAERPSLTIGPRSYEDIEAIGRAFNHDQLATQGREIEAAMEGLRTINRQEGARYHDSLRERMNADEANPVTSSARLHTVESVREITDEND